MEILCHGVECMAVNITRTAVIKGRTFSQKAFCGSSWETSVPLMKVLRNFCYKNVKMTFSLPESHYELRHRKLRLLRHWWFLHNRKVSNGYAVGIMHCEWLAIHLTTMVVHKLPSEIVINVHQNHDYSFGQMGSAGEALNSFWLAGHHHIWCESVIITGYAKMRITVMLQVLAGRRKHAICYSEEKKFSKSKFFWWNYV